jgi:hypothetical protein
MPPFTPPAPDNKKRKQHLISPFLRVREGGIEQGGEGGVLWGSNKRMCAKLKPNWYKLLRLQIAGWQLPEGLLPVKFFILNFELLSHARRSV